MSLFSFLLSVQVTFAQAPSPTPKLELGLSTKLSDAKTATAAGPEAALDTSLLDKSKPDDKFPVHCMTKHDRSYKRGEAGYADCMNEDKSRLNYERDMFERQKSPRPAPNR